MTIDRTKEEIERIKDWYHCSGYWDQSFDDTDLLKKLNDAEDK